MTKNAETAVLARSPFLRQRLYFTKMLASHSIQYIERLRSMRPWPKDCARLFLSLRLIVLYINELIHYGYLRCTRAHRHRHIEPLGDHLRALEAYDITGIQWLWLDSLGELLKLYVVSLGICKQFTGKLMELPPHASAFCGIANDVTLIMRRMRSYAELGARVRARVNEAAADESDTASDASTVVVDDL